MGKILSLLLQNALNTHWVLLSEILYEKHVFILDTL